MHNPRSLAPRLQALLREHVQIRAGRVPPPQAAAGPEQERLKAYVAARPEVRTWLRKRTDLQERLQNALQTNAPPVVWGHLLQEIQRGFDSYADENAAQLRQLLLLSDSPAPPTTTTTVPQAQPQAPVQAPVQAP